MAARSARRAAEPVEAVVEEAVVEEAVVEEAVVEEETVPAPVSPQFPSAKHQPVLGVQNDKVQLGIDGKNPVSVQNPSPKAQ